MDRKLNVCEIFHSIQAEGRTIGVPSVFLRLFGCNLKCRFKGQSCDTPYALIGSSENKVMSIKEVYEEVMKYECFNLVITGGCPLLQQDSLIELLKILPCDMEIEVETNGTISPNPELIKLVDQFNISPKLDSSNQPTENLRNLGKSFNPKQYPLEKAIFKFVVDNDDNVKEVYKFLKSKGLAGSFPWDRIYLMPMAETQEQYLETAPRVIELCKTYGFRFSPREHIVLFGKRRKV